MTRDINDLVVFFAQCRNLNRNVWKCNVSHTSNEIGLRQSRKSVGGGVFKEGFIWWNIPSDWGQRTMQRGKRFRAKQMGEQIRNGVLQYGKMDSHPQARDCYGAIGFSESPISSGVGIGQWSENEIAEAIFDWWISGKPYKQWYAEKYLQQKINFEDYENNQSI